jgi:hypothetical protein
MTVTEQKQIQARKSLFHQGRCVEMKQKQLFTHCDGRRANIKLGHNHRVDLVAPSCMTLKELCAS